MDAKCGWIAEATRVFNSFLLTYVARIFVIVDCFVYCLWPFLLIPMEDNFMKKKLLQWEEITNLQALLFYVGLKVI